MADRFFVRRGNAAHLYLNSAKIYDKINVKTKGIFMKKIARKINMAIIGVMTAGPAMAAVNEEGLCELLTDLRGVFNMLRTMAFIGAAFIIANWAWGYISKGEVKMDDLKNKGAGMLVGFILLFGVGMILSFLMTTSGAKTIGCPELLDW